jgi:hypothetical protein
MKLLGLIGTFFVTLSRVQSKVILVFRADRHDEHGMPRFDYGRGW